MVENNFYVSLDRELAKAGKTQVLTSQIDLLNMMERVEHLKQISELRQELRKKIKKVLTVIKSDINQFEKNLPELNEIKIEPEKKITPQRILPLPEPTKKELKELVKNSKSNEKKQIIPKPLPQTKIEKIHSELLDLQNKIKSINY
jgi:2-polyprenyl-3-methyl-5-hydroxy-6-metoxy-1,4-benzoquinol methylase